MPPCGICQMCAEPSPAHFGRRRPTHTQTVAVDQHDPDAGAIGQVQVLVASIALERNLRAQMQS